MSPNLLYETDYYAWTQQQAALLEGKHFEALDALHLLEELQMTRASLEREMRNRLRVLLFHLLKLQPGTPHDLERAGRGWRKTIRNQREDLAELLDDNPSLRHYQSAALARAWGRVGLDWEETPLPETCPWDIDQVLDPAFFPEADAGRRAAHREGQGGPRRHPEKE